jgi:hypothetical protein
VYTPITKIIFIDEGYEVNKNIVNVSLKKLSSVRISLKTKLVSRKIEINRVIYLSSEKYTFRGLKCNQKHILQI